MAISTMRTRMGPDRVSFGIAAFLLVDHEDG
jgi:hypothetical protein